jgi:hypothetical protein
MEILNLYKEIWAQGGGLRTLHVTLLKDNIEGVDPEAVRLMVEEILRRASYKCNFLGELKLDFSDPSSSRTHTKMGVPGCEAFWFLGMYRVVRTLSLDLTGNELGDEGVHLLVIGDLVHRRKLYLGLKNNSITSEGWYNCRHVLTNIHYTYIYMYMVPTSKLALVARHPDKKK